MSTPFEPSSPDQASMPTAPAEPSSSLPNTQNSGRPDFSHSAGSGSPSRLAVLLPIILMVLSLCGVGATLLYANHQAAAAPAQGSGRFPGGYTGQRPSGFPSGMRPSGFPSGGNFPSGYPSGGRTRPSGFPSGGTMPSGYPSGGYGNGGGFGGANGQPGQRPTGGNGNFQRPGQPPAPTGMHLTGLEIGLIAGCGVIFVGSAVFLAIALVNRRKPQPSVTPALG